MALREYDFENTPTVSIVKKTLTDAIKMGASDIHFDPTPDELVIKFRINGDLKEYTIAPENVKTNILTRIKIISSMNITDSILPQTGTLNFELDNKNHNMRVSSLPVLDGEKIVIHISNYASDIKNLNSIGFTEENINKINNLLKEQQGMILITGNTSSGKTTTKYSILKELNNRNNNIISIEEPVKMRIKGINQVQIAPEKGLTYRNTLKSVMLQDPNIIAIDELVDDDTTRSALRASLSGRLVISTMHTKTAYQTIDTLLNMDVENYLLGSNLTGIISQRLVKRLCPTCRELKHVTQYEASVIKEVLGEDVTELYYPNGCSECNDGYIEQIPIAEVIEIDEELRNAISNNKKRELIRNIINENNDSIIKDGFRKVLEGTTSFEEIIKTIDLRVDFTSEDKKIKEIILGNGIQDDENTTENQPVVSENHSEPIPTEEEPVEETTFVKVEVDNNEDDEVKTDNTEENTEKNNITNLQVSESEIKNMLSQIEANAINSVEEKDIEDTVNNTPIISSINNEEEDKAVEENIPSDDISENSIENNDSTIDNNENNVSIEEPSPEEEKEEQENNSTEEDTENTDKQEISNIEIKQEEPIIEATSQIEDEVTEEPTIEPIPMVNEQEESNIQVENINIVNNDSSPNEEVNNSIENNESTLDTNIQISENTINEQTPNIENPSNQIEEQTSIIQNPQPINFDDDDDDDDFNYGDSYINNF